MLRLISLLLLFSTGVVKAADDVATIRAALAKSFPSAKVTDIKQSPVAGVYEATANQQQIFISADGKYIFTGDLIDVNTRTNLSDQKRERAVVNGINKLSEDKMLVIGPKNPKHVVTVFTDVDCPYCARFHKEVPALNQAGIQVRYIFFPRAGLGSESYRRAVSVWCAKDRIAAIGLAKSGGNLEAKTCDNPIAEHYQLAQNLGIQGTPALILDTGNVIPGYVPADKLIAAFDKKD